MAKLFELSAQFYVIVDFPVEDNHGVPVVTEDRLVAMRQIDDLQSGGAQRNSLRAIEPALVRPAMLQ